MTNIDDINQELKRYIVSQKSVQLAFLRKLYRSPEHFANKTDEYAFTVQTYDGLRMTAWQKSSESGEEFLDGWHAMLKHHPDKVLEYMIRTADVTELTVPPEERLKVGNHEIRNVEIHGMVDPEILSIDLNNPMGTDQIHTIELDQVSVRGSDGIRICYNYQKDGWDIYQPQTVYVEDIEKRSNSTIEEQETWHHSAFLPSWKYEEDNHE